MLGSRPEQPRVAEGPRASDVPPQPNASQPDSPEWAEGLARGWAVPGRGARGDEIGGGERRHGRVAQLVEALGGRGADAPIQLLAVDADPEGDAFGLCGVGAAWWGGVGRGWERLGGQGWTRADKGGRRADKGGQGRTREDKGGKGTREDNGGRGRTREDKGQGRGQWTRERGEEHLWHVDHVAADARRVRRRMLHEARAELSQLRLAVRLERLVQPSLPQRELGARPTEAEQDGPFGRGHARRLLDLPWNSHVTATSQSRHSHVTVTSQSRPGHVTVV